MGVQHYTKAVTGTTMLHTGQFSRWHETPLEQFGIRPASLDEQSGAEHREVADDARIRRIPIGRVRAGQQVVNTARVAHYVEHPDRQPAKGVVLPSTGEVMLTDGHHRAAADVVRGRKYLQVRL